MSKSSTRIAALALCVSALLHVIAPIFGGFSGPALTLMAVGPVYALFAFGLLRELRWLAYLVFVIVLVGAVTAFIFSYTPGAVPSWLYTSIAVVDLLVLVGLFITLWQPKHVPHAS